MDIKALHPNFVMPIKATDKAGAFDIHMPEGGMAFSTTIFTPLGFAASVPEGHVALLLPRSGAGANHGLELNNTCGVIDSDYRGEWKAALRTKSGDNFYWKAGDRIIQFLIVPIANVTLNLVSDLDETARGTGGFGSTGK